MAYAYQNFFDAADGSTPTDFTFSEIVGSGGTYTILTNALRLLTTATNYDTIRAVLPSSNWSGSDGQALASYIPVTDFGQFNLIMRGSGIWSSDGDTPTNGYVLILNMAGSNFFIYRINGGVGTQVGTTQSFIWSSTVWYFTRFDVVGSVLKVKTWLHTVTEPAAWTYTVTDSSPYTTAGQFQMTFRTVSTAVRDLRVDLVWIQLPGVLPSAASGVGVANNATATTTGAAVSAAAIVATGAGAAVFDGTNSGSITIEIYTPTPGGGQAYNATVSTSALVNVAATVASGAGTSNTAQSKVSPNSGFGDSHGNANAATADTATGSFNVTAGVATGAGTSNGFAVSASLQLEAASSLLLTESGERLQSEESSPSLSIAVSPSSVAASGLSALESSTPPFVLESGEGLVLESGERLISEGSPVASMGVSPQVGFATGVGVGLTPSISTSLMSTVNAANVTGAGVANAGTVKVSTTLTAAAVASGLSNAPQLLIMVYPAGVVASGAANAPSGQPASPPALGVGVAYNPQITIGSANFVATAPIPVSATAVDPNVAIHVYPAGITVIGTAHTVGSTIPEPGQLVTVRDHGHTITMKER